MFAEENAELICPSQSYNHHKFPRHGGGGIKGENIYSLRYIIDLLCQRNTLCKF